MQDDNSLFNAIKQAALQRDEVQLRQWVTADVCLDQFQPGIEPTTVSTTLIAEAKDQGDAEQQYIEAAYLLVRHGANDNPLAYALARYGYFVRMRQFLEDNPVPGYVKYALYGLADGGYAEQLGEFSEHPDFGHTSLLSTLLYRCAIICDDPAAAQQHFANASIRDVLHFHAMRGDAEQVNELVADKQAFKVRTAISGYAFGGHIKSAQDLIKGSPNDEEHEERVRAVASGYAATGRFDEVERLLKDSAVPPHIYNAIAYGYAGSGYWGPLATLRKRFDEAIEHGDIESGDIETPIAAGMAAGGHYDRLVALLRGYDATIDLHRSVVFYLAGAGYIGEVRNFLLRDNSDAGLVNYAVAGFLRGCLVNQAVILYNEKHRYIDDKALAARNRAIQDADAYDAVMAFRRRVRPSLLRRITLWHSLGGWKSRLLFYGSIGVAGLLATLVVTGVIPAFGFLAVFGVGLPATLITALFLATAVMALTVGVLLLARHGRSLIFNSLQDLVVNNKFRVLLGAGLGVALFLLLTVVFGVFGAGFSVPLMIVIGIGFALGFTAVSFAIETVVLDWIVTQCILARTALGEKLHLKAKAYSVDHPPAQIGWDETFSDQVGWSNVKMLRHGLNANSQSANDNAPVSMPTAVLGGFLLTLFEALQGKPAGDITQLDCHPPPPVSTPSSG